FAPACRAAARRDVGSPRSGRRRPRRRGRRRGRAGGPAGRSRALAGRGGAPPVAGAARRSAAVPAARLPAGAGRRRSGAGAHRGGGDVTATAIARERSVALVGRPNVGKTSLLMHLTGTRQKPVNFPGTSVERCESTVAVDGQRLRVVDLPG